MEVEKTGREREGNRDTEMHRWMETKSQSV